ncbi:hypothetical protein [Pseudaminobacter soli (ex Li et al. 2025)]|uniref:Uncharacterized protein n=1 Tax=Pseudaminobacter soli (ex Li et al. 2025) TaxID=1295366 RepID=A0A2P7S056_9HYPH|nr:hypothetical protein [Mesorhizobium soli]PSJ55816.1 hypothetical protein C7I85_26385 [Mesorhizobium soli]
MGVSLDKLHGTAAYRDQNAGDNVDKQWLEKLHVTAIYRDTKAGYTDQILFDKIHVTAVYRFQGAAFSIVGDELRVAGGLTVGTHNVTVKATDANGKSFTKVIPITVTP